MILRIIVQPRVVYCLKTEKSQNWKCKPNHTKITLFKKKYIIVRKSNNFIFGYEIKIEKKWKNKLKSIHFIFF